jgi:hypothetical protein
VQIVIRKIAQLIEHPDGERDRQPGSRVDRLRVERQCRLEERYCLGAVFL